MTPDPHWLRPVGGRSGGPVLLCLPHAGAGAFAYAGWDRQDAFDVVAVQPPGREDRFAEQPITDPEHLVREIADALGDLAQEPLALFGHSLGALVAYDLARELDRRGAPDPLLLAVSGHVPPHRLDPDRARDRSDAELVEHVRELDDDPLDDVLADPEWRAMLLRPLRGDLALHDAHTHRPGPRLRVPVLALTGADDDATPAEDTAAWAELTEGPFTHRVHPGGHFYLRAARSAVLDDLAHHLEGAWRP
ncbi:Thioesterase PikA5 [Actinosynnema sp. ALI-1.44]